MGGKGRDFLEFLIFYYFLVPSVGKYVIVEKPTKRKSAERKNGDFQRTNLSLIGYCAITPIFWIPEIVVRCNCNDWINWEVRKNGAFQRTALVLLFR